MYITGEKSYQGTLEIYFFLQGVNFMLDIAILYFDYLTSTIIVTNHVFFFFSIYLIVNFTC